MDDERLLILNMLRDGKITAEEAEQLLAAIQGEGGRAAPEAQQVPPRPTPRPLYHDSDSEIRRQAREVAREVRRQAWQAAQEAKEAAREARRAAMAHARRLKHELRRRDFFDDDFTREIVDGIGEGLREGMRGLREGLDVGMREGLRGLREGMRGLSEAMRGLREGLGGPFDDRPPTPEGEGGPGRFVWRPGSDRCEAREEFERMIDLPAGTGLDLSATNGDCKVVLWDEARVKLQGVKRAWGATDEEARRRLGECDISANVEGNWLVVKERLPQGTLFGRPSCVDFVVYVPRETAMRLKAVNGDVECREAVGWLECRTVNGDMILGRIGAADLGSTNGDIAVEQAAGSLTVSNVNGDIKLGLATGDGDRVTARNVHGDIECLLGDGTSATIEASARVGDVVLRRELAVAERSGHRLVGRIGGGAGAIVLSTINGDVIIK